MRRSSSQQIIDWNQRRGDHPRLGMELIAQIDALQAEVDSVAALASPYVEFVPIRLVTTLEVFLRGVIAELVNGGQQYFERGGQLAKGSKIDLTFAAHIDRRELTIGDFVAHAVSLNSIKAVVSSLDTLLDGFAIKLKNAHPRWLEYKGDWPLPPIVEDYDVMMASLSRLFEVRHMLAHELPSVPVFDPAEASELTAAARVFIEATDWVVVEALHDAVPRTQLAMSTNAGDRLRGEEARLTEMLNEVASLDGIDRGAFQALQTAWGKWADEQANLVAAQVEGGSMYPMVWASEKEALTQERIDQLIRLKTEWMDV
ncbi:MAG: lysozyme inhibitor LprI family protein [Paracoccaceae bacterium]